MDYTANKQVVAGKHIEIDGLKVNMSDVDRALREADACIQEAQAVINETRAIQQQVNERLANVRNGIKALKTSQAHTAAIVGAITHKLDVNIPGEVFAVYNRPSTRSYMIVKQLKVALANDVASCIRNGYTKRVYYYDAPYATLLALRVNSTFPKEIGEMVGFKITLKRGKTVTDLLDFICIAETEKWYIQV